MGWTWVPTALTVSRLPISAVGYWAAFGDMRTLVVALAVTAIITDVFDGRLARRLGVASSWGANIDSVVDFAFYVSVLVWTAHFAPELFQGPWGSIVGAFVGAYVLLFLGGLVLARNVAVHNRLSRITAAVCMVVAMSYILWGFNPWGLVPVVGIMLADVIQRAAVLGRHLKLVPGG